MTTHHNGCGVCDSAGHVEVAVVAAVRVCRKNGKRSSVSVTAERSASPVEATATRILWAASRPMRQSEARRAGAGEPGKCVGSAFLIERRKIFLYEAQCWPT